MLLGCMGTFHTEEGAEPVRSALWFDERALSGVTNASVPREARVLLLNSTLPCHPDAVENDPTTVGVDEAASATAYWEAQKLSAFTREDALAVAFALYTFEPDWEGYYPIEETAFIENLPLLGNTPRIAGAAWFRMNEAAVAESDGVYASYVPTETPEYDAAVAAPAWVRITERDDSLAGSFSFAPTELSGSFRAEACDNAELYQSLLDLAVDLGYLGD